MSKLAELNEHLFAELARVGNECIKGNELLEEVARSKAICEVASQIVANGRLVLDVAKAGHEIPLVRKQFLLKDDI